MGLILAFLWENAVREESYINRLTSFTIKPLLNGAIMIRRMSF